MEKIGKYRIVGELGAGGFGTVFKAFDESMGREVAIKVLKAQDDAGMVKRFRAEAKIAANLRHPNVVTIFDFGEENGRLFLVMEYLDGTTLGDLISGRTPLSTLEKLKIMSEVALGLKAVHEKGIVHRDVKPANIMRLADGTVKIMDFGISRSLAAMDTRLTQTGFVIGTPQYMAPEQFLSEDEADNLCDIWAFGVVLYEFLTGVNPFQASPAARIVYRVTAEDPPPLSGYLPNVPKRLEGVLKHLLSKDRERRYQTIEDARFDLESIVLELRQPEIQRLIAAAEHLISDCDLEEAQGKVRRVLDLEPANPRARQLFGELKETPVKQLLDQAETETLAGGEAAANPMRGWLRIGAIAALALAVFLYLKMRPEAALNVRPAELSFTYRRGGTVPQPGVIEVTGKPADSVRTVAASDPWFTVLPARLTGDGSIQVQVNPDSLAPGEYSGFATVSAKEPSLPSISVRIHISVSPEPATAKPGEAKTAPLDLRPRVNPADGLTYVFIRPGSFTMGCSPGDSECSNDEKPPHAEQVGNGFWLGQTEVTQAAWKKVKDDNPSGFKGDQLPVESLDWTQAGGYCKAIGGRLPTEKEWEYAARAGIAGARYGSLDAVSWYSGNAGSTTHPVGLKQPNAFGLYDMLGNVWEWTSDDYASGSKVVRGGSWNNDTGGVRASVRIRYEPAGRVNNVGFRCVGEFR